MKLRHALALMFLLAAAWDISGYHWGTLEAATPPRIIYPPHVPPMPTPPNRRKPPSKREVISAFTPPVKALDRRGLYAAMFMQAELVTNSDCKTAYSAKYCASNAVALADTLIAELDKAKKAGGTK